MSTLEDLERLSEPERQKVFDMLLSQKANGKIPDKWLPNKGPQTEAYFSKADILLYGGAGGGGKQISVNEIMVYFRSLGEIDKTKSLPELKPMIGIAANVEVGDYLIGSNGLPVKVLHKTSPELRPFYRMTFDDGSFLDTSDNHKWLAYDLSKRAAGEKERGNYTDVFTTEWLSQQDLNYRSQKRFAIPLLSGSVEIKNPEIPVIPAYSLGYWLGNGFNQGTSFTCHTDDAENIIEILKEDFKECPGIKINPKIYDDKVQRCTILVNGFTDLLNKAAWKKSYQSADSGNKYIVYDKKAMPDLKWRIWSAKDRLSFIQGALDSDGHATSRGGWEFDNTNKSLILMVREMLQSLGVKPSQVNERKVRAGCSQAWRMSGTADIPLFRLKRKADQLNLTQKSKRQYRRYIADITLLGYQEGVCFSVDAKDRLFVAGRNYVVTHNSDLEIGLALTQHRKTLIMRRKYTDLDGLIDRTLEVYGSRNGFNGSPPPKLRTSDGRLITFGAANEVGKEQGRQGQAIDLLCLDEAAQFAESQVRFLMGWIRTTVEGQRTRVIMASNPPLSDEGVWVIKMFAPWLDPAHPNPAKYGELRWFVTTDDGTGVRDIEVDGPGQHQVGEELLDAMSRTFIPAKRVDNPFLDAKYKAKQDALPKHLRDAIRDGNFMAARTDHELQFIPTEWIIEAQKRWENSPPKDTPMCAIGVDCSSGGSDFTVLATRYDGWYAPLISVPGTQTPLGSDIAALVLKHRYNHAKIIIDMGGGYGGGAYERLVDIIGPNSIVPYKGSSGSKARTKNGNLEFFNKRAEAYGRFKEALDPDQPGGSPICLPNDPVLVADLCSIRLEKDDLSILKLEPKENMVKRIGRSTDRGDSVVMAWYDGAKTSTHYKQWQAVSNPGYGVENGGNIRILRGYSGAKRRR